MPPIDALLLHQTFRHSAIPTLFLGTSDHPHSLSNPPSPSSSALLLPSPLPSPLPSSLASPLPSSLASPPPSMDGLSATPTPTHEFLKELADKPSFIFPVYAVILTPLALYVYHDILDTRWRPVWHLVRFLIAYIILYLSSGAGLIVYIVIQGVYGGDYKEVGASALALVIGSYGAWKLIRLARIIYAHRSLVHILQRIDTSLASFTGYDRVGLDYYLFRSPPRNKISSTRHHLRSLWSDESRHHFISSSLFDDDYPGEAAARIKWLAWFGGRVNVLQEDADECASRVALWMRLVLRRPRSEPWRLLLCTSPLVKDHLYHVSLGQALRALITNGSARPPPAHSHPNPAEHLINGGSLTDVGVGFYWIASEMGVEEMSQVVAEMPPRWMRGVTQNGKQLMFEIVMSLVLCDMPHPDDANIRFILSLPVRVWERQISSLRVWSVMSEICADAVRSVMPRYTLMGEMPPPPMVYDIIQKAVFGLQEATSKDHGFQGDSVGFSLLEIIRVAYRTGFLTEEIMGNELQSELRTNDYTGGNLRLYKAEIVTGLFSILTKLGQHNQEDFVRSFDILKERWGVSKNIDDLLLAMRERAKKEQQRSYRGDEVTARYWYLGDRNVQCEDPSSAFSTVATIASELAPFVLYMSKGYIDKEYIIYIEADEDPDEYREQWMAWKHCQAIELGGSTHTLPTVVQEENRNGGLDHSLHLQM